METEIGNGDWRDKALCVRADPELFFPVGEKSATDIAQIQAAKSFCVSCLVQAQCLEYALRTGQDSGIWGGATEKERADMKRNAARNRRASSYE